MKTAAGAQTGTYTVQFTRRPPTDREVASPGPAGRLPRVTRLLVLAHKIDGMIKSGEIRDWAEAARLAGVTRARMTQISNLLLLSPDIQQVILMPTPSFQSSTVLTEQDLRAVLTNINWALQRHSFDAFLARSSP